MKVFILSGQSNMQGYGPIDGYSVLQDDRIFNLATGQAEPAVEPLHHWSEHPMPKGVGLGLAMPFALSLLDCFGIKGSRIQYLLKWPGAMANVLVK